MRNQYPSGLGGVIDRPHPEIGGLDSLPARPAILKHVSIPSVMMSPPGASSGRTPFTADITKPPRSVAEVVYDATPVAGALDLVREIGDRRPRPALPPGWQTKITANATRVLPHGLQQRLVVWQRNAVRRIPSRQTPPVPVPRE